jgi:hypothetical protein
MDVPAINQRLVDVHGKDFLGQPNYRVVWTDNEIEKRFGYFEDYVPGTNILIRRVKEVREVKKYSYLEPQWILEKLFFNQHNQEILDNKTLAPQNCTYEPFWAFGHEKNGRAKRPIWRAIELLILCVNNPKKLTPSQMNDEEKKQAEQDEKLMLDILNERVPNDALHSAVKDGDAVMLNQDGPKNG